MNKTESAENAAPTMAETLEAALEKIRVMLESSKAQRTTPKPLDEKQKERVKRRWLDQVVKLNAYHPQLRAMEDAVYEFCMGYARNGASGRRLVMFGENGAGKSHTAKAISRWAKRHSLDFTPVNRHGDTEVEARSPRCYYANWLDLIDKLKGGFTSGRYSEIFDECINSELLILDDVGTDNDPNKFGVERFYMLLEHRENRWTMITTNVGPEAWESRFERRIASRLMRNSTIIPLDKVPDYNSR